MFHLSHKKGLVTGVTGAIGAAIAKELHGAGAVLAVSGKRPETLGFAGELSNVVPILCDLSNLDVVDDLISQAEDKLDGLDILVCNAGIRKDKLALRMSDEDWKQVLDVNLTASFKLARRAIRGMIKREFGRVIFITSVTGWTGNPGQTNYCASKAGLTGMAKSLALEVANRNVTVNCIAPGLIDTKMTSSLTDAQKRHIIERIPLGRMGSPEDIAAGVLYLVSDEASYITGQTLHINGGMYMA
jgi:3-oxoacyl-[acyl-carrier protein] reductase